MSALLWLQAAATELGDTEVARAAATTIGRDAEPVTQDGVKRYAAVSAQSNLGLLLAATGRPDAHYDRVNTGLPTPWATGPILEEAPYPDVLVARAVTDGVALDLVLRPGTVPGRRRLGLIRLRPGGRYRVTGAVEREITADQLGRASMHVDLDQRRAIAVQPANPDEVISVVPALHHPRRSLLGPAHRPQTATHSRPRPMAATEERRS